MNISNAWFLLALCMIGVAIIGDLNDIQASTIVILTILCIVMSRLESLFCKLNTTQRKR